MAVSILIHRYSAEHFVTLRKRIERLNFADGFWRERPAHVMANEAPEPFAQDARLFGDLFQFACCRFTLEPETGAYLGKSGTEIEIARRSVSI
jgi:hypothetical protein